MPRARFGYCGFTSPAYCKADNGCGGRPCAWVNSPEWVSKFAATAISDGILVDVDLSNTGGNSAFVCRAVSG